jgi:hypothetical protein
LKAETKQAEAEKKTAEESFLKEQEKMKRLE